jgi:putative transposase
MAKDHRRLDTELVQEALLDDPAFLREICERVVQEILEAEMTEHIGAAPYERTENRSGQRNGYKPRALRTRVGTLNLLVPQDREGTFSTRLFARYQRNEKALCLALMQMYVEGVSTRKVKEVTEALCGTSFSKSLVSSLAGSLDAELEAWRTRKLEAEAYPYLFVDARYEKVRVASRVVSQGVLVVSGVRDDGFREILAVEVADTESEATYHELFRSLKARGLRGVELVVSDDHEGLKSAIARHFQGAAHQRCQVHYARNLLGMVAAKRRKELAEAHPYHQCFGEVQPGDKEAHAGGEDLPEQGLVPQAGERVGRRTVGGMADGQALPGHERTRRTLLRGGSDPYGALEGEPTLEETTETLGLDPSSGRSADLITYASVVLESALT